MSGQGNNRFVSIGGNVSGANIVAGDNNRVATTLTQIQPPLAHEVDVSAELGALRAQLERLATPEPGKLGRALDDASEEVAKPVLDKVEIANSLERAVKVSKGAADFAQNAVEIEERVVRLAGWLGPVASGLLGLLGLKF